MNKRLDLNFAIIFGFVCLFAFGVAVYVAIQADNQPTPLSNEQKAAAWCREHGLARAGNLMCVDPATRLVYWPNEIRRANQN